MSRAPQKFTEGDVYRAVKAVVKAGVRVGRVEIAEGKIVVIASQPEDGSVIEVANNEWD
jgi:hypothetical protein